MRERREGRREARTRELGRGHDGDLGERVGEAERGQDLPRARPDADAGAGGGDELVAALVEVDLDVVVAGERDGADEARDAAAAVGKGGRISARIFWLGGGGWGGEINGWAYQMATRSFGEDM